MKRIATGIAHRIDQFSEGLGRILSYLTLVMVVLTSIIVFERYVMGESTPALTELNWHLLAILFIYTAGHTLKNNGHVRVDLFYERLNERGRAWVNLLGSLFFLIPVCLLLIWVFLFSPEFASSFVGRSIQTLEGSPNPGGLQTFYILKLAIPIGLALLMLQGVAEILKNISKLRSGANE